VKKYLVSSLIGAGISIFFAWSMQLRMEERFETQKDWPQLVKLLNQLELNWYDFKFRLKEKEITNDVFVAEIDDASMNRFGRWPWPRISMKDVISEIFAAGAETVALDIVFSEPEFRREILNYYSQYSEANASYERSEHTNSPEEIAKVIDPILKSGNLVFGDLIERFRSKLVMGFAWETNCHVIKNATVDDAAAQGGMSSSQYIEKITNLLNQVGLVIPEFPATDGSENSALYSNWCALSNEAMLDSMAKQNGTTQGFFNAISEGDGVFRRTPLFSTFDTQALLDKERIPEEELEWVDSSIIKALTLVPSLALASVLSYYEQIDGKRPEWGVDFQRNRHGKLISKNLNISRSDKELSRLSIPVNPDGTVLVRFYGSQYERPFPVPKFSVASIGSHLQGLSSVYKMDDTHPLEKKLVIVGPTALAVYDLRPNPVQPDGGGVYIHANIAGRILQAFKDGSSPVMRYASPIQNYLVLIFLVFAVCFVTIAMGGFKGVWFYLIVAFAGLYFDIKLFHRDGLVFESFSMILSSIFALVSILAYKYFTEERDRAFVKGAFEKYVSPDVVGAIIADPKKLNLGGERRELSVLFSDVRGFTNISERMGAADLAKFMNDYLTPMTEIVLEEKGTIDKYMGDAIMAIFGAPIPYDRHPQQAVKAGLRMLERLEELKVGWIEKGLPPIDIGVGVNTGEMSVGNMGSTRIFSYTVMGDSVNLGSRIEGLTKEYDVKFIVSEFTRAKLGAEFVCRELDRVKVKGKDVPVTIYEVLGESSDSRAPEWQEKASRFEQALKLYYETKFDDAAKLFWALDEEGVSTSEIYVKRCALWASNPPPEDWDGSWTMKTK